MREKRSLTAVARSVVEESANQVRGAGTQVCLVFAAILVCAFWAGAVFASQPWLH